MLNWFAQIMLGLKYIHRHNILHRDLKTSNIFLQENGDLKIGDFGIARVLDATLQNAETVVGTPYYMSPEICQNHPYSFKSDVWSLGCILYELCTLEHPFKSNNLLNLVYKIVHEDPEPIPQQYSGDLGALAGLLLQKMPEDRPMLDQLLQVDFVKWFLVGFMNTEQSDGDEDIFQTQGLGRLSESVRGTIRPRQQSESAPNPYTLDRSRVRISSQGQPAPYGRQREMALSPNVSEMTPMEKLRLRKEVEVRRREEEMRQAVRADHSMPGLKEPLSSLARYKKEVQSSMKRLDPKEASEYSVEISPFASSNKSALKSNGKNVITNFESQLMKSLKHLEPSTQAEPGMAESRASYMNTIRQNLEETIQSQYFPDIKPMTFSKARSAPKPEVSMAEGDDFPPDFEDIGEE